MSNIIFPAGFTLELSDLNLEMMQYYAKQWNLDHKKMEKGVFSGNILFAHTPRIQLGDTQYSQGFMSKGAFPDGCILLICSANKTSCNFRNRSTAYNEISILKQGDEIDIITFGFMHAHAIAIEENLFYQTFYHFFGESPRSAIEEKRFYISPEKVALFHQTFNRWMTYLVKELPLSKIDIAYDKIENEMLSQFFNCIEFTSKSKKRKKFHTKKIRDILHDNIDQSIDIPLLTQELDISESHLHALFKKEYGITPKKYLQSLRLNAIKKDFLFADSHSTTVHDMAAKYHFSHMGHFSSEYKQLFGETPSQTLNFTS